MSQSVGLPRGFAAPFAAANVLSILEEGLSILRERRNVDFAAYRRATIARRFANRMVSARASSGEAYLHLLREDDREVDDLVAHLTIKVSRFYRNGAVFDSLRETIIPRLRDSFGGGALRAWSAGCAHGEEAYTLAMLLDGPDDTICATDIDERALAAARTGIYPASAFAGVPEALVNGFTHPANDGDRRAVSNDLRSRVQFSNHDVTTAFPGRAPYHLVSCRNVLMYFTRPLQARATRELSQSIVPGGILVLGEAEWPARESDAFEAVDRKQRIFRRTDEEVGR